VGKEDRLRVCRRERFPNQESITYKQLITCKLLIPFAKISPTGCAPQKLRRRFCVADVTLLHLESVRKRPRSVAFWNVLDCKGLRKPMERAFRDWNHTAPKNVTYLTPFLLGAQHH
jgi:hypothetical protein